jgi:tRNA(fMet)-specific endonuclease VapC
MRYLLDTNIVSELIRNPQGRVSNHIRDVGEAQVATSIIVAAELRYGAAKKGSPRLTAQVEAVLDVIEILPFEEPADAVYGLLRAPSRTERTADGQQRSAHRCPGHLPRIHARYR